MGDFAGDVTLLVESQEGGVLARRLAEEGAALPAGRPIALLAEDAAGADAARRAGVEAPTRDVYDASQPSVRVLEWQSYLKESREDPGCKKCMG